MAAWKLWELGRRHILAILGLILLIVWAVWWTASIRQNRMLGARHTWVPAWEQSLGLDFLNNYYASRHWLAGGDVYREPFGDPLQRKFCYPPIVLPLFAWCGICSALSAVRLWTLILILLAAFGVWRSWRCRQQLGLWEAPLSLALAGMLFSAPFLFALERGNYDTAVVAPLAVAAWALGKRSGFRDVAAGGSLALAAAMKLYPGLLLFALLPLRRYRAFLCGAVIALSMASFHIREVPEFWGNVQDLIAHYSPLALGGIDARVHTLSSCWPLLWSDTRLAFLARVPGTLAALGLIMPLVIMVAYRVSGCAEPKRILYPYLLWLAAAATFIPKVSIDYNLIFLPLAIIAVWDRRDPVLVHLCLAFMFLWAQPIGVPIGPILLLGFKYLSLAAVGVSLIVRAQECVSISVTESASACARSLPVAA